MRLKINKRKVQTKCMAVMMNKTYKLAKNVMNLDHVPFLCRFRLNTLIDCHSNNVFMTSEDG